MAAGLGLRLFFLIPTLLLGSCPTAASQALAKTPDLSAQSNSTSSSPAGTPQSVQGVDDEFRKRVEGRWNAARKGRIEVNLIPDPTNHEIFTIHVAITRPPAGSDGMTIVPSSGGDSWSALLKLDDEVIVRLSSQDVATFDIEPHESSSKALIRHLEPGGHADWTWTVKRIGAGGHQLLLQADVVYRRNFSPTGKPVITYHSAQRVIPLQ